LVRGEGKFDYRRHNGGIIFFLGERKTPENVINFEKTRNMKNKKLWGRRAGRIRVGGRVEAQNLKRGEGDF